MDDTIPLIPGEDHNGEEEHHEGEEETSFGGRENPAYDKDDYQTEDQRKRAKSTIAWLERNDLPVPEGLFYSEARGKHLVSENQRDWYKVAFGATSTGERFALIPFEGAPDPPLVSLLAKFGLEPHGSVQESYFSHSDVAMALKHDIIKEVKKLHPRVDLALVEFENMDGVIWVRDTSKRRKGPWNKLLVEDSKTGKLRLNKKLSQNVMKALGPPVEEVLSENARTDQQLANEAREINERQKSGTEREGDPERLQQVEGQREEIHEENAQITERMSLKERVKWIFEKYGVTVVGVMAAVGTVIGVIVSNLSAGLTKVAKGVGNGLKDLGKKLAGILPGMVGAIVSFLFKADGEAVGFLAKHAWLLILLVVTFVVEQYKK